MLYTIHEAKKGKFKRYKYVRAHQNENTTEKNRVTQIFLYLLDFIKKKVFSLYFFLFYQMRVECEGKYTVYVFVFVPILVGLFFLFAAQRIVT